jgi:hypothetical protein
MSSSISNSSFLIGHNRDDIHGAVSESVGIQNNSNEAWAQDAPAYRARRRTWTVDKSVILEDLEKELEAHSPIVKCETKCDKTYYECPMRNRFECPMVVRAVNEVVTGSILIETCAMSHCHDDFNEKFRRGRSVRVQASIREIAKFNVKIRHRTLHRNLLTDPYNFSGDVPINKVTSYLHRIRACASSSYMEYSVSGLCAMIDAGQRSDSFNNTSKLFFIDPAEKSIQFAGS